MTQIDDKRLMAFADGRLAASEAEVVRLQVERDPALQRRLAPFVHTRVQLRALDETLSEPVPDALMVSAQRLAHAMTASRKVAPVFDASSALRDGAQHDASSRADSSSDTIRSGTRPSALPAPAHPSGLLHWLGLRGPSAALVASLAFVVGGIVGLMAPLDWHLFKPRASSDTAISSAPPVAAVDRDIDALFERTLGTTPAGVTVEEHSGPLHRRLMPLVSIRTDDGTYCREYVDVQAGPDSSTGRTTHGLACLDGEHWEIRAMMARPGAELPGMAGDDFRPAGGVPAEFDAIVARLAPGDVMSRELEAQALARGWTPG